MGNSTSLDNDCDVDDTLLQAAEMGDLDLLTNLIDNGAKPDTAHQFGETPLMKAARQGHLEVVRQLIDAPCDVNRTTGAGRGNYTALHVAAASGHGEVVEALLGAGAKADCTDSAFMTPLLWAVGRGQTHIVRCLIRENCNVNIQDGWQLKTPLHIASAKGSKDIVQLLLEDGANPKVLDHTGKTALMEALEQNQNQIVQMLLKSKSVIDHRERSGLTPLHIAASKMNVTNVRLLLDAGADPNVKDLYGRSTLSFLLFCQKDDTTISETRIIGHCGSALLDLGKVDQSGESESIKGYTEFADPLVELVSLLVGKSDINTPSHYGMTALHWATQQFNPSVITRLLLAGADPGLKNAEGLNPLALAIRKCNKACIKAIIQGSKRRHLNECNILLLPPSTLKDWDVVCMLHRAGCNLKYFLHMKMNSSEDVEDCNEGMKGLVREIGKPHTLKHLSRMCVRDTLPLPLGVNIGKLTFPTLLKQYLYYEDLV